MRMFRFDASALLANAEWLLKCGGCCHHAQYLYVYADTEGQALSMLKAEEAGLCADCMCDLLYEEQHRIIPTNRR